MNKYQLFDQEHSPLLTLVAEDYKALERDLSAFAHAVAGKYGNSEVRQYPEYWKVIFQKAGGKSRFFIVKKIANE